MRILYFMVIAFLITYQAPCQPRRTKNVILITLDGFRWQELFGGADSILISQASIDKNVRDQFWTSSREERRRKLMPFFWNVVQAEGQLYGNRSYNNQVNCANLQWFSYPGYSELLTGFVDQRIQSNDKIDNRNSNVLEFINRQPGYEQKVAAFSTWDVFPYILHEEKSGITVNAGTEPMTGLLSEREQLLNELQELIPNPVSNRNDVFTYYFAFEYLKRERPRVLLISFDETDAYAHSGKYNEYLKAAHRIDHLISKLWDWTQQDADYKDQTTLLITTDHGRGRGRGDGKMGWRSHGFPSWGSDQTWIAVLGPDTPTRGEMKEKMQLYQKQVAATVAASLGMNYTNRKRVGSVISTALKSGQENSTSVSEISPANK